MFYKPKYCCNCGEKIERVDWNVLTSRRFCEACAVENKRQDYVVRGLVACGALGAMFGFGSLFGASTDSNVPVRSSVAAPATFRQQLPDGTSDQGSQKIGTQTEPKQQGAIVETSEPKDATVRNVKQTNGTKYFCGALTKKGTPCSRKVKAEGTRCFQHEGKSVAPPQNQ